VRREREREDKKRRKKDWEIGRETVGRGMRGKLMKKGER